MDAKLANKFNKLKEIISGFGHVTVAFSGGVDSSLLLYVANLVLGANVAAYFANSVVQFDDELESCREVARFIGVDLEVFELDLLSDTDFCQNTLERCYHCKKKVYSTFLEAMELQGSVELLDGTNLDDDDLLRPGSKVIKELAVKTPLRSAGFHKNDIRLLSREFGLPNWNRPSASCLATRVPSGHLITAEKLRVISQAEKLLHKENLDGCRVRLFDNHVVVELVGSDFSRFIDQGIHEKLWKFLKTEGLQEFFLDLSAREGILA